MVNTWQVTKEIPDGQTRRIGPDPAPATKVTMISAFAYRRPNELIHQWVPQDAYWALGRSWEKEDKAIASRRAAPGRPQGLRTAQVRRAAAGRSGAPL